MAMYIVRVKRDKFFEIKVEAANEKEARMKVENHDYDPMGMIEDKEGYLEIVNVRKEK